MTQGTLRKSGQKKNVRAGGWEEMLPLGHATASVVTCTKLSQLKFQLVGVGAPKALTTLGGGATGSSWLLMEEGSLSFGVVAAGELPTPQ